MAPMTLSAVMMVMSALLFLLAAVREQNERRAMVRRMGAAGRAGTEI
jgi:hypothetical protein